MNYIILLALLIQVLFISSLQSQNGATNFEQLIVCSDSLNSNASIYYDNPPVLTKESKKVINELHYWICDSKYKNIFITLIINKSGNIESIENLHCINDTLIIATKVQLYIHQIVSELRYKPATTGGRVVKSECGLVVGCNKISIKKRGQKSLCVRLNFQFRRLHVCRLNL